MKWGVPYCNNGKRGERKYDREGGEIQSTPTGKQNTAICSGRTDWNDYCEGNTQFWDFIFPPLLFICHGLHEWEGTRPPLPNPAAVCGILDRFWFYELLHTCERSMMDDKHSRKSHLKTDTNAKKALRDDVLLFSNRHIGFQIIHFKVFTHQGRSEVDFLLTNASTNHAVCTDITTTIL